MKKRPHPYLEAVRGRIAAKLPGLHERRALHQRATNIVRRHWDDIALGVDADRRLIMLPEEVRMEHMQVIGATGSGKSTYLLNCILQDIARGRGVMLLDPHGGHPGSILNMVLQFLRAHGFPMRKVHIISPNVREYTVGINPLAPLPATDPTVIADAMLKAFERAWGEDTSEKFTTRRVLRNVFTALADCRMTLAEADDVFNAKDPHGIRRYLIEHVGDERVRTAIQDIEELARDPRSLERFRMEVLGPANRVEEFLANPTARLMFGMSAEHPSAPANTIDLLSIIEQGDIILVDLQPGPQVSEAVTDMLGKILLRYLFLLMNYRTNLEPFFAYVDECQRFVTDDLKHLLDEARKFRIGMTLAHRYLAELGKPDDLVREAVLNSTNVKAIFRMNRGEEAETVARDVVPLDLVVPIAESIRPVVVGHTIAWLDNETYSVNESMTDSDGVVTARSVSRGVSEMQAWAHAVSQGHTTGRGFGSSEGSGYGSHTATSNIDAQSASLSYSYDPNSNTFVTTPILGMTSGTGNSSALARMTGESLQHMTGRSEFSTHADSAGTSDIQSGGIAYSTAVSDMEGRTVGAARTRGSTRGQGRGQVIMPVYKDLPTAFDTSKQNALHRAAERIRSLRTGEAIVRFRNSVTTIAVPPPRRRRIGA